MLKAGAAQIDITPNARFLLAGMGKERWNKQVRDPLMASALYVEDENTKAILVSCDLLNVKDDFAKGIRIEVEKQTGVKQEAVFICATHTHSGPKTGQSIPLPWEPVNPQKIEGMAQNIIEVAVQAWQNRQDAVMGYDRGVAKNVAFNRRFLMDDGTAKFAWRAPDPHRLVPEGPVDEEVQTLWFQNMKQMNIAVVVNFACHPVCTCFGEKVSADYVGEVRKVVHGGVGADVPVLFLQGAAGNISQMDYYDLTTPCDDDAGILRIGCVIGGEVLKLISQFSPNRKDVKIRMITKKIAAPKNPVTKEEADAAKAKFSACSEEEKRDAAKFKDVVIPYAITQLYEDYAISPLYEMEMGALALGDVVILTNPTELFVEYQLELKEMYPNQAVIMAELCNGHMGYVSTRLACALGGYEVMPSFAGRLDLQTGMMMMDAYEEMMKTLFPQGKKSNYSVRKYI